MPTARVDGRRLRAVRTRAAIVTALYDLVRAGEPAPTAASIAARAGVALRSIGQHFPSREDLLVAVAEHHASLSTPPRLPTHGPFSTRLTAFVRARVAELERSAPLRSAVERMAQPPAAITIGVARELDRRRDEIARAFATELADHPAALARVDAVASGAMWDQLRRRLSARAAGAEIAVLVTALLR